MNGAPAPGDVHAGREMTWRVGAAAETAALGARLAELVVPGDVVCVCGPLGAGKTTFVQGLAAGLGVRGPVPSPTFTILRSHPGRVMLHHVDLYRVRAGREVDELGLDELAADGVLVVEWGERLGAAVRAERLEVEIAPVPGGGPDERTIRMRAGPSWAARLERLR